MIRRGEQKTTRPTRPFVRYPGSKNRLAGWLTGFIPRAHDSYILTHGGSAATLFAKDRSRIEVYNDINGDLVHLFRTIRDEPDELIRAIFYTPWSAAELRQAREKTADPLERARRFYLQLWASIYPFDKHLSFRRQKVISRSRSGKEAMTTAAQAFMDTEHLFEVAERLRGVAIEQTDATKLIKIYDNENAFFYADPPYVLSERTRKSHYEYEYKTADHRKFAEALYEIEGMAMVSGYNCPLYLELYELKGWIRYDRPARVDGSGSRQESLWLNPAAVDALALENGRQLELFEEV